MKVLFISHNLYPCKTGGAEIFNYYLLKVLSRFHKLFVITLCKEKTGLDVTIIRETRRMLGLARISIPFQDMLTIIKLRKEIDLIHITYMRDHWLKWITYPLLKKIFNIPYIITIHGGGMHPWKPEFPHRLLFSNAADIIGISKSITKEYERRSKRRIKYIPPLIPFTKTAEDQSEIRSRYGFSVSEKILLYLGSIKMIKGCDTLINSFIKLGKEYIKKYRIRLLLAGDGNLRHELEKIVRQQDLASQITFLGNVPREDVPALFKLSDIYILPSHFEGTPLSMLEAMFNGIPIIGSNVGGINNIIENKRNGLLFEVNNADDLKVKIIHLIENKELAGELAIRAIKDYENTYNFEAVVDQYEKIYNTVGGADNK
jgi:glycosyltransferase involved in cell wall biosynthesis